MDLFQAVSLGVIQGLTEFLPVSSSGHLVLLQNLFGLKEPELFFDICLHVGTLLAVTIFYFNDIRNLLIALFMTPKRAKEAGGLKSLYEEDETFRLGVLIICGSVPTAMIGMFFSKQADSIFGNVGIVGIALLVTGIALWMTRYMTRQGRSQIEMSLTDALVIGVIQGLAIIPGISRSGSTIATALFLGINREVAGRFSFLLSLPAILGALVLGFTDEGMATSSSVGVILFGTIISAIVGYLALVMLIWVIKKGKFSYFSPYCWIVGVLSLWWAF